MNNPPLIYDQVSSRRITSALVRNLEAIVRQCEATAVFVYADALNGQMLPLPAELQEKVLYFTRTSAEQEQQESRGTRFIRVPAVPLSRLGQVKIAMFLALAQGVVRRGDIIVCLTGMPFSGTLDTLLVTQVGGEPELFATIQEGETLPAGISAKVVERTIDIAVELGSEGREGKPVGGLFVVGDAERVVSLSRQLIMNPFKGYAEEERNILDPNLEETIKEFSTIDGAFIIDNKGVIVTCGAFLKTPLQENSENSLPQGLGARHHAAAGITCTTNSIAITVSESTGTVTVFRNGRIVTEIEKPRMQQRREL